VGTRAVPDKGKKVEVGNGDSDAQKTKEAPSQFTTKYCVLDERSTKLCNIGECKFSQEAMQQKWFHFTVKM
jgi:hypothetical protein